jgi:hypothetical protein
MCTACPAAIHREQTPICPVPPAPPLITKMSEAKGTNDMSLRANRKTRAPTIAKRISGPVQKATNGLPGPAGKLYGAQPRPQAGGKV